MGIQKPFAHNGNKTCLLKNVREHAEKTPFLSPRCLQ